MGKKKNRPLAPRDAKREKLARRGYAVAFAMMFCAIAKVVTSALFDLGAIALITGELPAGLAVESGLGRVCLIVAMLVFIGAAFGLRIKRTATDKEVRNIVIVNVVVCIACLVAFALGLSDGHEAIDNVVSLLCAAVAAYLAFCCKQVSAY